MARVSVAMATFNGAAYVAEQVASICSQSRHPDQLVIYDDASEDETVDIVVEVLRGAPFAVELRVNDERTGAVRNFGQALAGCSGDVIVLADQDDIWHPSRLKVLESLFERAPDVGGVFGNATIIDRQSVPTGDRLWNLFGFHGHRRERWELDPLSVLIQGNVVTGATLALRADIRDLVLPMPDTGWHDLWIALLTVATSRMVPLDEPLISYRVHDANATGVPRGWRAEIDRRRRETDARDDALEQYRAVVRRLRDRGLASDAIVSRLQAKARHLAVRTDLSARPLTRAAAVMSEVASGRYHRYSAGARSALFDWAYGGRT